jgi:sugar lactone lactonase YvrE
MFMHEMESIFALPLGRIYHVSYHGTEIRLGTPVRSIPFPNGLVLSHDKSQLAVASTTSGEVRIYDLQVGVI